MIIRERTRFLIGYETDDKNKLHIEIRDTDTNEGITVTLDKADKKDALPLLNFAKRVRANQVDKSYRIVEKRIVLKADQLEDFSDEQFYIFLDVIENLFGETVPWNRFRLC